jgi:hypothetical protein
MGTADVILDLVSSGTTLRENNLRELAGGKVLASEVSRPGGPASFLVPGEPQHGLLGAASAGRDPGPVIKQAQETVDCLLCSEAWTMLSHP